MKGLPDITQLDVVRCQCIARRKFVKKIQQIYNFNQTGYHRIHDQLLSWSEEDYNYHVAKQCNYLIVTMQYPVLSSFMTYHRVCNQSNTTGDNSRAGSAYPSETTEFTTGFHWGSCYSIFSFVCRGLQSLFVFLFFFFWSLCCLSFFFWSLCCLSFLFWSLCCLSFFWSLCCLSFLHSRILISPLVSSNSSYTPSFIQ